LAGQSVLNLVSSKGRDLSFTVAALRAGAVLQSRFGPDSGDIELDARSLEILRENKKAFEDPANLAELEELLNWLPDGHTKTAVSIFVDELGGNGSTFD
jgi:hypothetical protein